MLIITQHHNILEFHIISYSKENILGAWSVAVHSDLNRRKELSSITGPLIMLFYQILFLGLMLISYSNVCVKFGICS